ncbi:MAG: PP2C family protein-serine/threonine phosphatase, partial [Bacteroidia bacterium]
YIAIAVADCTGHGVPGAFMSMLGYDILKNALHDQHVNSASEALDYLNNRLSKMLRSASGSSQVRDGMDIAFCVFDPASLKLYYAGANNPCWVIKKDKSVTELDPDKQPIGFFENGRPFTLKSVQLEQGDSFYLFTDGYADQFGGPKGKKFKYKQLRQTLTDLAGTDLRQQRAALKSTFETWKGHHEQIDDVTVIGVRV